MKLIDLLYPKRCPLCGEVTSEKIECHPLCEKCNIKQKENRINYSSDGFFCVYKYNGKLRDAVLKYKYEGEIWLAEPFACMIINYIEQNYGFDSFDILAFVPVNDKRLSTRGYDQVYEIAKIISKKKKIRVEKFLKKKENYGDNAVDRKDRRQRISEDKYYFAGDKNLIYNKRVLLLDDIVTTGATLRDCKALLIENGARNVCTAVIASGRKDL